MKTKFWYVLLLIPIVVMSVFLIFDIDTGSVSLNSSCKQEVTVVINDRLTGNELPDNTLNLSISYIDKYKWDNSGEFDVISSTRISNGGSFCWDDDYYVQIKVLGIGYPMYDGTGGFAKILKEYPDSGVWTGSVSINTTFWEN